MRIYTDLAAWWPLLSPPSHYVEEAASLVPLLTANGPNPTVLELGSGGGSLASHLKQHCRMTLSDLSPAMLANSRAVNPELEHLAGDMRTIRLGRTFDVVFIHDAIMYATDAASVRATLATAAVHCRSGGTVVVAPDCVRETFAPTTEHGGEDAPDGRGLRYLEWSWDPDPGDTTSVVVYALALREADGTVRNELDRHIEGLFGRDEWLAMFRHAGLPARSVMDEWGRDVFVAGRLTANG